MYTCSALTKQALQVSVAVNSHVHLPGWRGGARRHLPMRCSMLGLRLNLRRQGKTSRSMVGTVSRMTMTLMRLSEAAGNVKPPSCRFMRIPCTRYVLLLCKYRLAHVKGVSQGLHYALVQSCACKLK